MSVVLLAVSVRVLSLSPSLGFIGSIKHCQSCVHMGLSEIGTWILCAVVVLVQFPKVELLNS